MYLAKQFILISLKINIKYEIRTSEFLLYSIKDDLKFNLNNFYFEKGTKI